jgi:hypothetical protein
MIRRADHIRGESSASEHDPEKRVLGLDPRGGKRFSEKIMLQGDIRFPAGHMAFVTQMF